MTQDKRKKLGVKTNSSSAKSRTADQRAKKKLSATFLNIVDSEDELLERKLDLLPMDIREGMTGAFTTKAEGSKMKPEADKAKHRIISQAVEGSAPLIRQFRTSTSSTGIAYPAEVIAAFKEVDKWTFDVFALNEASERHSLKYIMCEVFNKYDLLSRFQIPLTILIAFAEVLEEGYGKHHNTYHNAIHAADVTQTVHSILLHTGAMHWFTDLEILAIFFSAIVHDYEHTGTTNNFHVQTKSETALLYNDTSVLENHHLSAAYKLVQKPEFNILANLTPGEWREMRQLVIKMILATDVAYHFQHMKNTLRGLQQQERLDRSTVMSTIVHVADLSHPAKPWELHQRWVAGIMEEFFKQGAMEIQLGLPISPLCDRETTNIAESEIVFIDVIVKPVFSLLFEVVEKVIVPFLQKLASSSKESWFQDVPTITGKEKKKHDHSPYGNTNPRSPKSTGASAAEKNGHMGESEPCSDKNILNSLNVLDFKCSVMQTIETNRDLWKDALEPKKEESPDKEAHTAKDHVSETKTHKEKTPKRTKSNTAVSKSKKYCVVSQSYAACDCQLCDSRTFEPMDVNFIVYNASSSEMFLPRQDSDAMEVTESYEELLDNESSWRNAAGQTVESNIQEMRALVPKTKPLSPNESDDVIIEEYTAKDPEPQPQLASGPPAISGPECSQPSPNVGFIMTDLTQSDMEIFSRWNEEVMRRASELQKQGQIRKPPDAPLQVAVSTKEPTDCPGCDDTSSGKPPETFVLQVISFDSPSVTWSNDAVLNCAPGQGAIDGTPTNDGSLPENTSQPNQTNFLGAAAVSVTTLSYGLFKISQ